jgi:hypothetical protein
MKVAYVLAGAAVLALGAVLVWTTTDRDRPGSANRDPVTQASATGKTVPDREHPEAGAAAAPTVHPVLDCAAPAGDAGRTDKGSVSAADLCGEFLVLAGKKARVTTPIERGIARQTLERMLDEQLIAAALAEDHTAVTEADVDAGFAELDVHDPARPSLTEQLKRQGVDVAVVRRELRRRLQRTRLVEHRGQTEPKQAEVVQEYQGHPELYVKPGGGTKVQGYLSRVAPHASAEADQKAHKTAEAFALAARTQDPAAMLLKDKPETLAPFVVEAGGLEPGLAAALANVAPGQWILPVRTKAGWLVAKVLERVQGQRLELAEASPSIVVRLRELKRVAEEKRILATLRAAAHLEILVDL